MQHLFSKEYIFHTLFISLAVILGVSSVGILFFEDSYAVTTRVYDDENTYVFEDSTIEALSGGIARLAELDDLIDDDDDMVTGFGAGTFSDTEFDGGSEVLQLDATGLANGVGMFTSRVMYGGVDAAWETLTWDPMAPYRKDLPDNEGIESAYDEDNIDMTDNILLLHLNESDGSDTFSDTSGIGSDPTCDKGANECPVAEQDSVFHNAICFDGINDSLEVPYNAVRDELTAFTISVWLNLPAQGGSLRIFEQSRETNGHQALYSLRTAADNKLNSEFQTSVEGIQTFYSMTTTTSFTPDEWNHVVITYDGSEFKQFVNGEFDNSIDGEGDIYPISGAQVTNYLTLGRRINNSAYLTGCIDEFAMWSRAFSDSEIESLYNRGAKGFNIQVRSCGDATCEGEEFIGPDGTDETYYSEASNTGIGKPSLDLTNVANNEYFQYQVTVESDIDDESPQVASIEIGPDHYSVDSPYVVNDPGSVVAFNELVSFEETLGANNGGTVTYQISPEGNTFYYFDGDAWVEVESDDDTNTAIDVNTNISTFHEDVDRGKLFVKSFLHSPDNTTQVELESITYGYEPRKSSVSSPSSSGSPSTGTTSSPTSTPTTSPTTTPTTTTQQPTTQPTSEQTETTQQPATQPVTQTPQVVQEPVIEGPKPSYSVSINNEQSCTASTAVVVSLLGGNSIEFQLSEDTNFTGATWKPLLSALQRYTLSNVDGEHTVFARFRDVNQGISPTVSDSIVLDQEFNCVTPTTEEAVSEEIITEEVVEEPVEEVILEEVVEEVVAEELIPLPSKDGLVHGRVSAAYYLFKAPLTVFPFLNQLVFFTHGLSFNTIPEVDVIKSDAQIEHDAYPLSGSVLIKTPEDDKVYLTKRNTSNKYLPFLQWIANESVAETLFGNAWNKFIIDVSTALIENAPKGPDVLSLEDVGQLTALKSRLFLESSAPHILFSEHEKANNGYTFTQTDVLSDGTGIYEPVYTSVTDIAGKNVSMNQVSEHTFDQVQAGESIYAHHFDNLDVFNNYTSSESGQLDNTGILLVEKSVRRDIEVENDVYLNDDFSYDLKIQQASCTQGSLVLVETIAIPRVSFVPEHQQLAQVLGLAADYYAHTLDMIGFTGESFVQSIHASSKALLRYEVLDGYVRISFMNCQ